MAQHPQRVIRVFSLPVQQFDHFKAIHRYLQQKADREAGKPAAEGDPHWITNSAAMAHLLAWNELFVAVAARHQMHVDDFAAALHLGDLTIADNDQERSKVLPTDAAEHLAVFRREGDHANQLDALIDILRTHAAICEMSRREGKPVSGIYAATRTANEWHREGVKVTASVELPAGTPSH